MILAIDIGNSKISIGLYDNNKLVYKFKLSTNFNKTEDEYALQLITCLNIAGYNYLDVKGIIISSVVMSLNNIFERLSSKYFKVNPMFIGSKLKSGIIIKLEQPKSLGPDILVCAVSAYEKYGGDTLVIDLGTATTMTIVTKNKEFIGGAILPGIITSANSLSSKTSVLPYLDLDVPTKVIENETIRSMQSGIVNGYGCMIEGMIVKMEEEYGHPLKVVMTGNEAHTIKSLVHKKIIIDEDLILDGLLYLYNKNINTIK